ncbi:MAG TPA: DUF1684 domain-containing protein, partial [Blastocatellia bacterium]|nr:DUF1684 domain-containing protein [Blastocatellia bacterium]
TLAATAIGQASYSATIKAWREKREAELRSDGGWLTVAGLFWLKEGANRFGTDPSNEIVLPKGSTLSRAGAFEFHGGKTTLRAEPGANVLSEGRAITALEIRTDADEKPTVLTVGAVTLQVIKRGERYGVRMRDKNSRRRREFTGLRWFPAREPFRIKASFVAYDKPRDIAITNVLGDVQNMPSPGYALFALGGRKYRLDPVLEDDRLFFIFSDLTSGKSTYPAGRFLYSDMPENGFVTLDFNQAVNPPCAFTSFATCPLPPRQNRLKVAISAGEKRP